MVGSMSPKEAWDKFVGSDVSVTDFLARIEKPAAAQGSGLEGKIAHYLGDRGADHGDRSEACRLIAEYISQSDQPAA